jgi:hypothetical protein
MPEFAFEVDLVARVRVCAADADSACQVVPSVIAAPGPDEIALANATHTLDVAVTAVDFTADRKIKLVGGELGGLRL